MTLQELNSPAPLDRFLGCLLGGAAGDALGAPVAFMDRQTIRERFGPGGIRDYSQTFGRAGVVTDDTQLSLFTAEGLLRGWVRQLQKGTTTYAGVTAHAYARWLRTQGEQPGKGVAFGGDDTGWLFLQPELHNRRAPGSTSLDALRAMESLGAKARNDSKGCGGLTRVAPAGLFAWHFRDRQEPGEAFALGADLAALTHGHPTGFLPGGVLAVLIQGLAEGRSLPQALEEALACLRARPDHRETLEALERARALASSGPSPEALESLGQGWEAQEALAMAVYCALAAPGFEEGVVLAVNQGGDSDSTGALAGHLLGTLHGAGSIPQRWLESLELRGVIQEMAEDLFRFPAWDLKACPELAKKYPGF